ncbi:hypothetical protein BDW68DRAFT_183684 [Aspergillus falconensis]
MSKRPIPPADIFKGHTFKDRPKFLPTSDSPPEYLDHTWENGRRYRGHASEFPFPNDDDATMAYSCLNSVWVYLLRPDDVTMAPITLRRGNKVLDCAARATAWMYKAEETYPGIRISVIDPGCAWLYPNDIDVHHQVEGEWGFTARQGFHLVRAQGLGGLISDYEGFYRNVFRHLLPGGWVEVRENDLRFVTDSPSEEKDAKLVSLRKWEKLMEEAAERFGKPINVAGRQKELMEQAGFTDVREEIFKVPLGHWMEGDWARVASSYSRHLKHGLEGYTLRLFTKTLGWSLDDTMDLIKKVQEETAESERKELQLYSYFRVVIGKKPDDASRKP